MTFIDALQLVSPQSLVQERFNDGESVFEDAEALFSRELLKKRLFKFARVVAVVFVYPSLKKA